MHADNKRRCVMCQARLVESRQLKSRMRRDAAWGKKEGFMEEDLQLKAGLGF